MPHPTAPRHVDATVAFDDVLVERWHHTPCVLCQAARPGHDILWMASETGFVAMFPLCQRCQRRPDKPVQLAHASQARLHPEEP
jgi:hypothetical protein